MSVHEAGKRIDMKKREQESFQESYGKSFAHFTLDFFIVVMTVEMRDKFQKLLCLVPLHHVLVYDGRVEGGLMMYLCCGWYIYNYTDVSHYGNTWSDVSWE